MAVAVFMFACGGPQQKTETVEVDALSISALMENVDQYVGDTVTVQGTVGHVCRHGGDKMFLVCTETDQKLKVELSGDLTSFTPEMEGLTYTVTGVLEGIKIDEEYLANGKKNLPAKNMKAMLKDTMILQVEKKPTWENTKVVANKLKPTVNKLLLQRLDTSCFTL